MKKGITLIELMAVIIVLGILTIIAIPNIKNIKSHATLSQIKEDKVNVQKAIDRYSLEKGQFPTDNGLVPSLAIPKQIDWTKLEPPYLIKKPENLDKVHYWIDYFGTVWASEVDSPKNISVSNAGIGQYTITWKTVEGVKSYNVGYAIVDTTVSRQSQDVNADSSTYVWLGKDIVPVITGDTAMYTLSSSRDLMVSKVVVNSVSQNDLISVPVENGYEGVATETTPIPDEGTTTNYALFGKSLIVSNTYGSLTDGGTTVSSTNNSYYGKAESPLKRSSGKWYAEVTVKSVPNASMSIGIANKDSTLGGNFYIFGYNSTDRAYKPNGAKIDSYTDKPYGATYTQNDIIGMLIDLDNGTLSFTKNGISQGVAYDDIKSLGTIKIGVGVLATNQFVSCNLGSSPFIYQAPEGYLPYLLTNVDLNSGSEIINDNFQGSLNSSIWSVKSTNSGTATIESGQLKLSTTISTHGGAGIQTVINFDKNKQLIAEYDWMPVAFYNGAEDMSFSIMNSSNTSYNASYGSPTKSSVVVYFSAIGSALSGSKINPINIAMKNSSGTITTVTEQIALFPNIKYNMKYVLEPTSRTLYIFIDNVMSYAVQIPTDTWDSLGSNVKIMINKGDYGARYEYFDNVIIKQ